uniref:Anillin-like protein 1 (inferred by orthology to a C. elegans protein) n=1 Tax=Strongyloides venezuelensis TaxID=75913 RepID=A0A0K0F5G1_STRVS
MENSPVPLAKKLLEKARERQKEIDDYCASPIKCPVDRGRTSSLNKENMKPPLQKEQVEDVVTSTTSHKPNHFTAIAESYKNFEYESCHVPKSKEDYLLSTPRKISETFEYLPSESGNIKSSTVANGFYQVEDQIDSSNKPETPCQEVCDKIDVLPTSEESVENNGDQTNDVEKDFNRLSVVNVIHSLDEVEKDQRMSDKSKSSVTSPNVTNTKAMDIVKKFDCNSRNFRTPHKQAAVKFINGKVAVKSLRPGALSPTLLYGSKHKIDMRNSEIVIPESASVKNLKSRWEANITSGVKMETNDRKISSDSENIIENTPTSEVLVVEEKEEETLEYCNSVLQEVEEDSKSEVEEGQEDKIIDEAFEFVHVEEPNTPSPSFDCKIPKNLMDDISSELNKFDTPRNRLAEKMILTTDIAVDSPQRKLVHRISFYRKKAKEIEEVVRHNIDSASSDVVSSSGCSGCGTSSGSHNNEYSCEGYIDIEAKIKKLEEGIRVQHDQIAQASRAILYCRENDLFKGSREEIDAQRALLIANEKKKVLLLEYEKIKKGGVPSSFTRDPRGALSITSILVRLSKEFVYMHVHQKIDSYVYYFIVLVKIAEKVFHTQLISTDTEIKNGYIEFPVLINIRNLPSNFVGQLEIFSLRTKKDSRHGKDSKGRNKTLTPFKRLSQSMSSSSSHQSIPSSHSIVSSNFHKIGMLTFDISQVSKESFVLKDVKQPLEGKINIKMDCIPEKGSTIEYKGFLNLYQFVGDLSSWNRYWCVLKGPSMVFWKYPEEEDKKSPAIIIDLESVKGGVKHINDESACFPNTMELNVEVLENGKLTTIRILFAADTTPQMESWLTYINETTKYISLWNIKKKPSKNNLVKCFTN